MELIFALLWVVSGVLTGAFILSRDDADITAFDIFFVTVIFGTLGLLAALAVLLYYSDKLVVIKGKQDIVDKES